MDFEKAKEKLVQAFSALQNLQIQPTKNNVEILTLVMNNIDEVYGFIDSIKIEDKEEEKKEE